MATNANDIFGDVPEATPDIFADVPAIATATPEPDPLLQDPGLLAQRQTGFERLPTPKRGRIPSEPSGMKRFVEEEARRLEAGRVIKTENRRRKLLEVRNNLFMEGKDFDESGFLGEDFNELRLRADFMRSDKNREMFLKFHDVFPVGDIKVMKLSDGENVMVFREDEDQPFKLVDPEGFEMMAGLADVTGSVATATTAAEIGSVMLTGGASAAARALATGIAAGLGEVLDSMIEDARSFEESSKIEIAFQATVSALFGGAAERLLNFRRDLPKDGLADEEIVDRIQEFLRSEGIPEIMIGQISKNPLIRAMFQQSRASTSKGSEILRRQNRGMLNALERRAEEVELLGTPTLKTTQDEALLSAAREQIAAYIKDPSRKDLGEISETIVNKWYDRERASIGKLYDSALALKDNISFDLSEAQALANTNKRGVLGVTDEDELVDVDPVTGEFVRALDDVLKLKSVQEPRPDLGADSPIEVLKRLRTRFFLLSRPDAGRARRDQMQNQALDMYKSLTKALDNPRLVKGDEGLDKAFTKAWDAARTANAKFESTLDNALVTQLIQQSRVEGSDFAVNAARQLIDPDAPRGFEMLMKMADPAEKTLMKDAYITSLMRDPTQIRSIFRKWVATPRAGKNLATLIDAPTRRALVDYGKAAERLSASSVQKALDKGEVGVDAFRRILQDTSRKRLHELVTAAGGKDSEYARGLVAGFYSDILKKPGVIKFEDGQRLLDHSALRNALTQAFEEKKIFTFMDTREAGNLKNFVRAASIFSGALDVGGALRRGAIVGGIRQIGAFTKQVGAAHALATDKVTLAILSSPAGRKFMRTTDLKTLRPGTKKAIRVGAILLTNAAIHAERVARARQSNDPEDISPTATTPPPPEISPEQP